MTKFATIALACGSAMGSFALMPAAAQAQDVSLNYDRLSSLEEPIAFDLGQVTVEVTGVIDTPVIIEFDELTDDTSIEAEFVGNFQISASTQLANRWNIGVAYFGQYATAAVDTFDGGADYSDNVAAFVGTSVGTVLGGNVNGQVRELTRRQRGVGNAFLAFDDFYGSLDDWGGAYQGRFGPTVLAGVVDENGDFELGGAFQRPLGQRDIRFSARYRQSEFVAADGITAFDSSGVGLVGELVYGSTLYDVGLGYETLENRLTGADIDRWFLSAGAQTQLGPVRLSGEAHFGQIDGEDEISAALGASYDIARGLSFNLGVNYQKAQAVTDTVTVIDTDEVKAIASLRFSF